jgi:SAM-dependent methyltransferase
MMKFGDGLRAQIYGVLHSPPVKRILPRVPFMRGIYLGWNRPHPFDREYGIETSGFIEARALAPDPETGKSMHCYGGSQPGIVRRVLATLPDKSGLTFVDLGCGKGRVLVVASEFNFKEVIGVDVAKEVLDKARENAAIVHERFPGRTPIKLVQGNAYKLMPEGDKFVFYLYHPFGREGVEQFLAGIEDKIQNESAQVFVVYCNPVWSGILDHSRVLSRWSAATLKYDNEEIGYGPDMTDTVVVWQSKPARYPAQRGATRHVYLTGPMRAELETSPRSMH